MVFKDINYTNPKTKTTTEAFSLVELMISLITISLISAAFAPVITKKLSRSMVTVKSAVAAVRSDCEKFNNNGGTCNACIDDSCLLCDIHCSDNQYKNIGKCLCENCSERSEGCLECSSQGCDKCADGYYIDESLKCVKCPKGSKCPNGKKRELCPIGYYQDEEKKTTCKPCLTKNGNYTNKEGSIACLSCIAGQYTVDKNWDWHWDGKEHYGTACATCPAGYYCPDGKSAFVCGNNNYQDETGKTSCKGCPNGTFSPNSPSSSCSACDGKCSACYQSATNCSSCKSGNYLTGSSCNSCPANANCSGGTSGYSCNSGYTLQNGSCIIAHQQPICQDSGLCSFSGNISGNWQLRITGSTIVRFRSQEQVDIFVVGGGGAGSSGSNGSGGCSGFTSTVRGQTVKGDYNVIIGVGGNGNSASGSTTSFANLAAAGGGGGGQFSARCRGGSGGGGGGGGSYGGRAGSDGSDGGPGGTYCSDYTCENKRYDGAGYGQGSTTRAFGESTGELFAGAGGGAGGNDGNNSAGGGDGGGGSAGWDRNWDGMNGKANTGGGGGGCAYGGCPAGLGGSGVALVRNKRW